MTTSAPPSVAATNSRDLQLGLIGTAVAVTMWGLSGVLVKSIDMDAMAVGFWRFLIYALLMWVYLGVIGERPSWRVLRHSAWGGLALGLDVVLFFTAVKLTTIVNATTIGSLQPLVVAVFAWRMFGERITLRQISAALVAIVAVIVIVVESSGTPEWNGAGDLASVGALFAWSAYFVFSKRSSGVITPMEFTAGTATWTTLVAGVGGLIAAQDMAFPPSSEWLPLLALVLGSGVLGHSVMNWSLVRIPLWLGSTLTLLIPVVSSLAAWIWLDEPLTLVQIAAMAVVLGSLAVIVKSQSRPEPVRAPQATTT